MSSHTRAHSKEQALVSYTVSKDRKSCSPESKANKETTFVTTGLRRCVNEIFALLGCYATIEYWFHLEGSNLEDGCTETSVTNYQSTLPKIPEKLIFHGTAVFVCHSMNIGCAAKSFSHDIGSDVKKPARNPGHIFPFPAEVKNLWLSFHILYKPIERSCLFLATSACSSVTSTLKLMWMLT